MSHAIDSEIRSVIADTLSSETGVIFDAGGVHLPSRNSAASIHIPYWLPTRSFPVGIFPALFGEPFVSATRTTGGWLLIDFFDSFYDALVDRIRVVLPASRSGMENHTINKLTVLARHGGTGCPHIASFQRALLLSLSAQKSPGAYASACRACERLWNPIPPRERPALIEQCGALSDALARLLFSAR